MARIKRKAIPKKARKIIRKKPTRTRTRGPKKPTRKPTKRPTYGPITKPKKPTKKPSWRKPTKPRRPVIIVPPKKRNPNDPRYLYQM